VEIFREDQPDGRGSILNIGAARDVRSHPRYEVASLEKEANSISYLAFHIFFRPLSA
jgi:hypothetical protein